MTFLDILMILVAASILGIVGYFMYKHFTTKKVDPPKTTGGGRNRSEEKEKKERGEDDKDMPDEGVE